MITLPRNLPIGSFASLCSSLIEAQFEPLFFFSRVHKKIIQRAPNGPRASRWTPQRQQLKLQSLQTSAFESLVGLFWSRFHSHLYPLSHFALQFIWNKVLKHKTPSKCLSLGFILLCSHKVSVEREEKQKSYLSTALNRYIINSWMSGLLVYHLKIEFVTGYLSNLNGSTFTSLTGDSPSLLSAALVPISSLPPEMFTISPAAVRRKSVPFW